MGEEAARQYLTIQGLEYIRSNYRTRFGEIDLIFRDKGVIVFVEVKTKSSRDYGMPEEMCTRYKMEKIRRMGIVYLGGKEVPCRIDMVAVDATSEGKVQQIRHYINVG